MGVYSTRDATLRSMGYESYTVYLLSPLWRSIRRAVFRLKGVQCSLCSRPARQIHHLDYGEATLRGEDLSGLAPICRRCHFKIEFKRRSRRKGGELIKRTFYGTQQVYNNLLSKKTRKTNRGRRRRDVRLRHITEKSCRRCGQPRGKGRILCRLCSWLRTHGLVDD
jgi:hypothetical protein